MSIALQFAAWLVIIAGMGVAIWYAVMFVALLCDETTPDEWAEIRRMEEASHE